MADCRTCGQDNPDGARFCRGCGGALTSPAACPACGAENLPGSRFCNQCGGSLNAEIAEAAEKEKLNSAVSASSAVRSFVDGRYQVKRFLGEGGKKRVYLAHDTLLDRDVAFALIKTEGLDDDGRERVQREAQAMGKLGTHPHVVSVYDIGTDNGQPYLVTEFMAGGDVEGLLEKAEGHRLPIEHALRITRQVCTGLDFAHGHGLVHRDLKPGNVWLTAPYQTSTSSSDSALNAGGAVAKIGDFGLAVALDRSRLTQAGTMVGTVAYMPPEQAMGSNVGPRADLYSVGCMLYEMIAGRPPFVGDDSVAIIGQHLNTAPVAPTWHSPDCPPALEALVLRLLAKTPAERPPSAAAVLADLDAMDLAAGTSEVNAGADPLERLATGSFVGRIAEALEHIYRRQRRPSRPRARLPLRPGRCPHQRPGEGRPLHRPRRSSRRDLLRLRGGHPPLRGCTCPDTRRRPYLRPGRGRTAPRLGPGPARGLPDGRSLSKLPEGNE